MRLLTALTLIGMLTAIRGSTAASAISRAHAEEINTAVRKLHYRLSEGLCQSDTTCPPTSICTSNPCEDLKCPEYPDAVCYFCCCSSRGQWTMDGVTITACPVMKIASRQSTNGTANLGIPVPLLHLLRDVLPTAKPGDGFHDAVLRLASASAPRCSQTRIQRCKRTPSDPSCRNCVNVAGRKLMESK